MNRLRTSSCSVRARTLSSRCSTISAFLIDTAIYRQELQKLRAFGRERRARQIVLEIHEADQLALVQNRLAEDGPRLLLLHVRVRHEPSILLRVVDNDDLFRPRGEMNDAEGCEAGAVR